jgi:hypothetical protein
MNIFRRTEPRRPAPGHVTPLDNTRPLLSPEPGPPQGSMSGPVCPEFDPCGAPAIGTRKGGR